MAGVPTLWTGRDNGETEGARHMSGIVQRRARVRDTEGKAGLERAGFVQVAMATLAVTIIYARQRRACIALLPPTAELIRLRAGAPPLFLTPSFLPFVLRLTAPQALNVSFLSFLGAAATSVASALSGRVPRPLYIELTRILLASVVA